MMRRGLGQYSLVFFALPVGTTHSCLLDIWMCYRGSTANYLTSCPRNLLLPSAPTSICSTHRSNPTICSILGWKDYKKVANPSCFLKNPYSYYSILVEWIPPDCFYMNCLSYYYSILVEWIPPDCFYMNCLS